MDRDNCTEIEQRAAHSPTPVLTNDTNEVHPFSDSHWKKFRYN